MTPHIGQIIYTANEHGSICPAIVTLVHSDTCLNAHRFNRDGSITALTSLVLSHDPPKSEMEWNFIPKSFTQQTEK